MLGTYFAKSLELLQTAIFADKLQDFSKGRRVCRQGAEFADKNFFQGGVTPPTPPHPDGPEHDNHKRDEQQIRLYHMKELPLIGLAIIRRSTYDTFPNRCRLNLARME